MKKLNIFLIAVLFLTAAFQGCKKGDEGPQGKTGEQGIAGEKGAKGDKGNEGEKGATGNANVKVFTKSLSGVVWTMIGNNASGYLSTEINAPNALTSDIINNWVNLVYVRTSDFAGEWALLPYYTDRNIRVTAILRTGSLILNRDQDGKPFTQSNFSEVKVVSIKPSSSGSLSYNSSQKPNLKNYAEVSKYYNLKD